VLVAQARPTDAALVGPHYRIRLTDPETGASATVTASLCSLLASPLAAGAVAAGKESLVLDVTAAGTIAGAYYKYVDLNSNIASYEDEA